MAMFKDNNGYPVHLSMTDDYQPGDMPPYGYIAKQEWAAVQIKAGLKSEYCGECRRWFFPQELNPKINTYKAHTSLGDEVTVEYRRCLECDPVIK